MANNTVLVQRAMEARQSIRQNKPLLEYRRKGKMSSEEKVKLREMIGKMQEEYVDNTAGIRENPKSIRLRDDILRMEKLKRTYSGDIRSEEFAEICRVECRFLYDEYTLIFNKQLKDLLNLKIMFQMLQALRDIEDGRTTQEEGSVVVGKFLKEIYVDSAMREKERIESEEVDDRPAPNEGKFLSWKQFKQRGGLMAVAATATPET